ncbi:MAG: Asp23/Gls24 family envelope stress response protein [Pseudonocardia sp.]
MTAATLAPAPPAPAGPPPVPPAQRGELTVSRQVVEKIAAAAAIEVEHVGGAARRVLAVSFGSDAAADRPQVEARVDGSVVTLAVRCSVAYPASAAAVTQALRPHRIDRIDTLTGLRTRQVDIVVSALVNPRTGGRRELR